MLFVAGGLATNPFFDRERHVFEEISCATFSFSKPFQVLARAPRVFQGARQSLRLIRAFCPDLVVGFGSFYTLPLLLAARWEKIPIVLHEQNAIPGKVNRLFSRAAKVTATTFPGSAKWLKGRTQQVVFPLRESSIKLSAWDYFGLDPEKKTVLVFGGSQGAHQLNEIFFKALPSLPPIQVLHFVGKHGSVKRAKAHYESNGIAHFVNSFETEMSLAWQIADLALTRAGAGTIAELIESETPALLVPFPKATENHQLLNARYFTEVVKGGELLTEKELQTERFTQSLCDLLENSLAEKKASIQQYKQQRNIPSLATLISKIVS